MWRDALKTLETKIGGEAGAKPLGGRNVLVLGNGGIARSLAYAVGQRKGLVSVCGPDDAAAKQSAAELGCRYVPYHNLFDTLTDAIVLADPRLVAGQKQGQVNPSLFKAGQYVVDAADPPEENSLYVEAKERGCKLVSPVDIFQEQTRAQFKSLTGKDLPEEALAASGL